MPTDNPTPAASPVDLTEVLAAAARCVNCELDIDELVVANALQPDLVLRLVHAAVRLATLHYTQALLAHAAESLQYVAADVDGTPVHADELAYLNATLATVDHAEPLLRVAIAHACRRLHATGLGLVWPVDHERDPPTPDQPATPPAP
ncbi:MAG TPA: hypothetical protein VH561_13895 [Micromonosporaceae bacterium]|jgi:hypothetical protein